MENWIDIGSIDELSATPLKRITVTNREFAVSYKDGTFGVLSNTCNHVGGPLGKGRLEGEYIVCPWHNWKFHRCSGEGELGSEVGARLVTSTVQPPRKLRHRPMMLGVFSTRVPQSGIYDSIFERFIGLRTERYSQGRPLQIAPVPRF